MVSSANWNSRGLTIVELLVVMGIIAILAGVSLPVFLNLSQRRDLAGYQRQAIANLAEARDRAQAENRPYGLYFQSDRFTLFQGDDYQTADDQITTNLPSNISFSTIQLPNSLVIFEPLTGEVRDFDNNNNQVIISNDIGESQTLTINQLGVVNVE